MRKITLGHLDISERGKAYVNDALDHNRLSRGPYTDRFESEFSRLHGCKHGLFMNSGTSALQVALVALKEVHGYADGDEVIVPATTFIATSNIVIQNNLTPVFVDVDPFTFNIDPRKIEEKLTSKTRCIIPVHLFGLPAEMKWIRDIAKHRGLQIIEDSCETMFATLDGQSVGSFGDIGCFSTYVAHLIVGGVGGLVTTNDPKLNEICKSLMQHGRDSIYTNIDQDDNADDALLKQMIERRYSFERVGYSYRATELEAAVALSELERWEENIGRRRFSAARLTDLLKDLSGVLQLPVTPVGFEHSYMMFPMVFYEGYERNPFLWYLEKNGIETRYLFPLLTQPVYRTLFPGQAEKYPIAQYLAEHGFFIGMHQGLLTEDIEYISEVIHDYFKKSK
jgi:dTDP-4-amino-4,6-dideoxygalactose transaminase